MKDRDSLILQERYLRQRQRLLNEDMPPFEMGGSFPSMGGKYSDPFFTTSLSQGGLGIGNNPDWHHFYSYVKDDITKEYRRQVDTGRAQDYRNASPLITDEFDAGNTVVAQGLLIGAAKAIAKKVNDYIQTEGENGRVPDSEDQMKERIMNWLTLIKRDGEHVFNPSPSYNVHIARVMLNNLVDAKILVRLHHKGGKKSGQLRTSGPRPSGPNPKLQKYKSLSDFDEYDDLMS